MAGTKTRQGRNSQDVNTEMITLEIVMRVRQTLMTLGVVRYAKLNLPDDSSREGKVGR